MGAGPGSIFAEISALIQTIPVMGKILGNKVKCQVEKRAI
jgi:hypothetical protein